ncbi:MAG: hypothetical protein ACK4TB_07125 [Gemmobacter sp.]
MTPRLLTALCLAALAATAADRAQAQGGPEWQVTVQPYVWATGVSGTIRPTAASPTFSFNQSIGESLSIVDGAFALAVYARRERFVMLGDFWTVSTARGGIVPPGLPARAATGQTIVSLAAGYRAWSDQTAALDVYAGIRAFWLDGTVEVPAGTPVASRSVSFVDPIIGLRYDAQVAPRWSATLQADIGGFGVGSRFTAVGTGLLNYHVNDSLTLSGGVRLMNIAYDDGATKADITLAGPMLALAWRF